MKIKPVIDDEEEATTQVTEFMRRALVDALLRNCDGRLRVCGKAELSPLEQEWVQDIVDMVARSSKMQPRGEASGKVRSHASKDAGASPLARALSGWHPGKPELEISDAEFHYVPIACGPKGDYFGRPNDLANRGADAERQESDGDL